MAQVCSYIQPDEYYLEYRIMPRDLTKIPTFNYTDESLDDLAIILQGPICHKDNYTISTIEYYRKLYPNAKIILSTWDTEKGA